MNDTTDMTLANDGGVAVPDALIDEVVGEIRRLTAISTLQLSVAIGELLLHRFFDGDIARLRARGDKDTSLRRLAEHPDLPFSASTLSRHVSVFEVVQRIGGLDAVKNLTHHHIRYVLDVPERQQVRLLTQAEKHGWSATVLREKAAPLRKPAHRGGRPPLPHFLKAVTRLHRASGPDLLAGLDALPQTDPAKLAAARDTVAALHRDLAALLEKLDAQLAEPR
jgi:hypothetical protein